MINVFLLTLEDINTRIVGNHLEIVTVEGTVLNFTKEAIEELKIDIDIYLNQLKIDNKNGE